MSKIKIFHKVVKEERHRFLPEFVINKIGLFQLTTFKKRRARKGHIVI